MARHLHEQSGGNPAAQGPVPELANDPKAPRERNDFPDAPETERSTRRGGDLSEEQLDDFAARLGLADEADADGEPAETPRRLDRVGRGARSCVSRLRSPVGRVLVTAGRWTATVGDRVRSTGERLTPR